jgi:hypothetical protein
MSDEQLYLLELVEEAHWKIVRELLKRETR